MLLYVGCLLAIVACSTAHPIELDDSSSDLEKCRDLFQSDGIECSEISQEKTKGDCILYCTCDSNTREDYSSCDGKKDCGGYECSERTYTYEDDSSSQEDYESSEEYSSEDDSGELVRTQELIGESDEDADGKGKKKSEKAQQDDALGGGAGGTTLGKKGGAGDDALGGGAGGTALDKKEGAGDDALGGGAGGTTLGKNGGAGDDALDGGAGGTALGKKEGAGGGDALGGGAGQKALGENQNFSKGFNKVFEEGYASAIAGGKGEYAGTALDKKEKMAGVVGGD